MFIIEDAAMTFLDFSHQNPFYVLMQIVHDQSKMENIPTYNVSDANDIHSPVGNLQHENAILENQLQHATL